MQKFIGRTFLFHIEEPYDFVGNTEDIEETEAASWTIWRNQLSVLEVSIKREVSWGKRLDINHSFLFFLQGCCSTSPPSQTPAVYPFLALIWHLELMSFIVPCFFRSWSIYASPQLLSVVCWNALHVSLIVVAPVAVEKVAIETVTAVPRTIYILFHLISVLG